MDTTTDYAAYDVEDAEVAPKHATIATGTDSRGRLDAELDGLGVEPVAEPTWTAAGGDKYTCGTCGSTIRLESDAGAADRHYSTAKHRAARVIEYATAKHRAARVIDR